MNRLRNGWEYSIDKRDFGRIWKEVECNMKPGQSNIRTSGRHQQIHTFNPPHASTSMDSSWTAYRSAVRDRARRSQLQDFVELRQKDQPCLNKCQARMQFAFCGTFDTITQDEGASLVSKHGGTVTHLVSHSAGYTVLGRAIKRAQFRNLWSPCIKMIGEVEFYQLPSCPTDISIKPDPPSTHFRMNGYLTTHSSSSDTRENGHPGDPYTQIPEGVLYRLRERATWTLISGL
jgi:hypothetical protein